MKLEALGFIIAAQIVAVVFVLKTLLNAAAHHIH